MSKPEVTIRRGRIEGSAWRNVHKHTKRVWYSLNVVRHYTDHEGAARMAHSFGVDDMLVVAEVSRQLWDWVQQQDSGNNTNPNVRDAENVSAPPEED